MLFYYLCNIIDAQDAAEATDAPLLRWFFRAPYQAHRAYRHHRCIPQAMGFQWSRHRGDHAVVVVPVIVLSSLILPPPDPKVADFNISHTILCGKTQLCMPVVPVQTLPIYVIVYVEPWKHFIRVQHLSSPCHTTDNYLYSI